MLRLLGSVRAVAPVSASMFGRSVAAAASKGASSPSPLLRGFASTGPSDPNALPNIPRRPHAEHQAQQRTQQQPQQEKAEEESEEEKSTGPLAHVADIPRTGQYPLNPYLTWVHGVEETCPNWSWDHASPAAAGAAAAVSLLPFPRPLPGVYVRNGYRPSDELGDRKRRMMHVFSCILTGVAGVYMVFFHDHGNAYNKGVHVFSPLQKWAREKLLQLNADPAIDYQRQQAQLLHKQ